MIIKNYNIEENYNTNDKYTEYLDTKCSIEFRNIFFHNEEYILKELNKMFKEFVFIDVIINKKKIDTLIEMLKIAIDLSIIKDEIFNNSIRGKQYIFFKNNRFTRNKKIMLNYLEIRNMDVKQSNFIKKLLENTNSTEDIVNKFKKIKTLKHNILLNHFYIFKKYIYKNGIVKNKILEKILKTCFDLTLYNYYIIKNLTNIRK